MLDLTPEQLAIVQEILKRHVPERTVWAFGSRVKNTAKETSDLDLAILGDKSLSSIQRTGLTEDFDESLLPFKVDVVEWANLGPEFREIITQKNITLQHPF